VGLVLALSTLAGIALLWRQRSLRREADQRPADQPLLLPTPPDAPS
jgi:hypothetical protein